MVTHENGGGHGQHQPPSGFIRKYIFSIDHKVIGIQYLFLALFSVFLGMALSLLMRLHLAWPNAHWFFFKGGLMTPEQYLALVTMHGTIMVFMVLTTAPQSGFGNYFLPIQIGAADMAFPVLNMLSFWTTFVSLMVMVCRVFRDGRRADRRLDFLSAAERAGRNRRSRARRGRNAVDHRPGDLLRRVADGRAEFHHHADRSSRQGHDARAACRSRAGRGSSPRSSACWRSACCSPLASCCCSTALPARASSFPAAWWSPIRSITWHKGGSPLLWQHLFWFFGHPEVYIAILPGMGVASHLLSTFSRKPVFGYRAMVGAICGIGFLGFCVWGHHMFISGMSPYSAFAFSILTMTIGVPSAIKTFNWLGTLWGGKIQFNCAMLFALGFVSLFVTGGLSGLFLAQPSLDLYLHDTYFVVAHFHLIMGVAAIFGMFAGTYFWFPKMFGRLLNEGIGKVHFWLTFIGVYCIFMPMHFLGLAGHPRRYSDTTAVDVPADAAAGACVHHHRGVHHDRRAVDLPVQLFLQHDCGQGSQGRESVARDDARMVDSVAASVR